MIEDPSAEKRARAAKRGISRRVSQYRIEGETLTFAQIGKRLGISKDAASLRMRRLRGASGAITWLRLRNLTE